MCCSKHKNTEDNLDFIAVLDAIDSVLKEVIEDNTEQVETKNKRIPIEDLYKKRQIEIYKDLISSMEEDIKSCLKGKDKLLEELNKQEELILVQRGKIEELEGIIDDQGRYIDELEDENYDLVSRIKDIAEVINSAY
jgi:phage terminase small subunit